MNWRWKKIYVWFEAVIGYLSASKEWAINNGTPEAWKDFWLDKNAESYYFVGKDNVPFSCNNLASNAFGLWGFKLTY